MSLTRRDFLKTSGALIVGFSAGSMVVTRAQGPLLRTLLGSVGQEVAGAADCDVLLVPSGLAQPKSAA